MAHNSPSSQDRDNRKTWGRGRCWTTEEIQYVRDHMEEPLLKVAAALNRPHTSLWNVKKRILEEQVEEPPVLAPGEYISCVHAWIAEDFELFPVWLKWNGFSSAVILSKDRYMMCTILATAK